MVLRALLAAVMLAACVAAFGKDTARQALQAQIEAEAREFCRTVHHTSGSLGPSAIKPAAGSSSRHPDLIVRYAGIRCAGVESPAMAQGGYCGLTMEGMKCEAKLFKYRDGRYTEAKSWLE